MDRIESIKEILLKMIKHCDLVSQYIKEHEITREKFLSETVWQDAMCYNILQIGELASLNKNNDLSNINIPWSTIKRTRDVYVHHYNKLDIDQVWQTVNEDLPELRRQIKEELDKM